MGFIKYGVAGLLKINTKARLGNEIFVMWDTQTSKTLISRLTDPLPTLPLNRMVLDCWYVCFVYGEFGLRDSSDSTSGIKMHSSILGGLQQLYGGLKEG